MDNIYLVIMIMMLALAVSDLIVGVSNDAVNFLNSAFGSKAAPRWVILAVASAGILLGSIFSSGMMEVARSGVFFPSQFYFHDVMLLFLAVMFTDVILLDMFNTFGLPTSTTVSLVFELLGAGVAVAAYTMWNDPNAAASIATYINATKALGIISGILSSVVIAFITGMIVMFVSRVIFSFRYKPTFKFLGPLWCGIALTAISYFAVFKGLKGSSIMSDEIKIFLDETKTIVLLVESFGFWTVIMAFIQYVFRFNILRLTVLAGTLSLALAFAGNDLVNFIGVFMAGKSTYEIGQATFAAGGDLSMLKMAELEGPVAVEWLYLFAAGVIMTITIWSSKKARSVSETEINLSRQDEGVERFGSTLMSRAMVRSALNFNERYKKFVPEPVQRFVNRRFRPLEEHEEEKDKAPFDLIRATVNLTSASILIAMATSLKLPLSTTYVTFMVAMGTSLADRAWGRETAVYRITGVLTVIAGWFMTAFIAFTVAFIVAMVLLYGGEPAIYIMAGICVYILVMSKLIFARRRKKEAKKEVAVEDIAGLNIINRSQTEVISSMEKMTSIYSQTLYGLFNEDRKLLKETMKEADVLYTQAHERKHSIMPVLRQLEANNIHYGHYFVQIADYLNEVAKALVHITRPSFTHIDNNHQGLSAHQINDLRKINGGVSEIYERFNYMLKTDDYSGLDETLVKRDALFDLLVEATENQVKRVIDNDSSARGSVLYLAIITETKTMILQYRNLIKSHKRFLERSEMKFSQLKKQLPESQSPIG